ncbi:hypothetical protein VCR3J2_60072 [Vibrio coralliirubri]|nr:hypothetical protein VCR3J2_60072 [Vibrio coralliirubri]
MQVIYSNLLIPPYIYQPFMLSGFNRCFAQFRFLCAPQDPLSVLITIYSLCKTPESTTSCIGN